MLINFLDSKCKPVVQSSVPCSEGYEIENLIAENVQNGFLAYSCIRPPVDIDFTLVCNVNLNYILIEPQVGAQKSTGFEILIRNKSSGQYQSIAMAYLCDDECGVIFYNGRTFLQKKHDDIPTNYKFCAMKNTQWRLFSACEKIRVRILRTTSSVPCIGKIQMWGYISKTCSSAKKLEVLQMCNKNSDVVETQQDLVKSVSSVNISKLDEHSEMKIPDDFLDSLTFEVMCMPMTLPSGNNIDQTTLEKHIQTQEIWARKPFDPFTGQIFTDTCKPIFNTALKNRIDHFLIQNKDESFTQNIPRTVGGGRVLESRKRTYSEIMEVSNNSVVTDTQTMATNTTTNENSLDFILNKTLSKLKRFTTLTPTEQLVSACVLCNVMENLYILKCSHLFCRDCLIKSLSDKCVRCNQFFQKCDISRYHA